MREVKGVVVFVCLLALSSIAFAAPAPTLSAPTDLSCYNDGSFIYACWVPPAEGTAIKYSVEVEATYTVDGEPVTRTFEYTTTDPWFTAALGDFDGQVFDCLAGEGACVADAESLSLKVKGLTAGGGRGPHRSQNNPFAGPCDPLASETDTCTE